MPNTFIPLRTPCLLSVHVTLLMVLTPKLTGLVKNFTGSLVVVVYATTGISCQFVNGGEFPVSLGAYSTIPKARRGGPIDRTLNKFLDIVHMDIGFGDCMSIGGARYALILVDRATRYNWVFSLKSLSSSDITLSQVFPC